MTVRNAARKAKRVRNVQVDEDDSLEFEDAASIKPTLIRTYGEFWDPELISLSKSRLMGRRETTPRGKSVNVFEERGVYVLYKDFEPVYVGKADGESIGARIQKHRKSLRRGPRWNQFSWFGVRGFRKNGNLLKQNGSFHPTSERLIATFEALLISTIDPPLNSRRERFKNAVLVIQSDEDKPSGIEDRLESIEKSLLQLLADREV